jgi:leucyl/phenylalanyl-tRNA--protein transferase
LRLEPGQILRAYRLGFFPMAESRYGPVSWYSPDPRAIIPLDSFHVGRSLRRTVRRKVFDVRCDTAFERVVCLCAQREETWISEEIVRAYCSLFEGGWAHSVECWREGDLAGGLYGVAIGAAFFGESMFSLRTDASKVALVHLVEILRSSGYTLLDAQFATDHLRRFGACELPREEYLKILEAALARDVPFASRS